VHHSRVRSATPTTAGHVGGEGGALEIYAKQKCRRARSSSLPGRCPLPVHERPAGRFRSVSPAVSGSRAGDEGRGAPSGRSAVVRALADHPDGATISTLRGRLALSESGLRRALSELSAAGIVTSRREEPTGRGRPSLVYRLGHRGDDATAVLSLLVGLLGSEISLDEARIRAFGRRQASALVRDTDPDPVLGAMARLGFAPHDESRRTDRMRNERSVRFDSCPFRGAVASGGVWAVCALHLGLVEGLAEREGGAVVSFDARDPISAGCQTRVRRDEAHS
jgi:predicted ArsR family transcriptional regulator